MKCCYVHLQKRQSQRVPPTIVTDLDFADDRALITQETEQAQEVLTRLEQEAGKVGLHCNAKKTEIQAFNDDTPIIVNSRDDEVANKLVLWQPTDGHAIPGKTKIDLC